MAKEAAIRIKEPNERITALIDIEYWREAIQESYNAKLQAEYADEIRNKAREKGVSFIDDFFKEEEAKRKK